MEYTGLNMLEALELPCDLFMLCRKNGTVKRLMQSEEGREYLESCKAAKQTKPDWDALHRLQGKLR
jgi:hypothetical protein